MTGERKGQTKIHEARTDGLEPQQPAEPNAPGDVLEPVQESPGAREDIGDVSSEAIDDRAALRDKIANLERGAPPGIDAPSIPSGRAPGLADSNHIGDIARPGRDRQSVDNLPFGRKLPDPADVLRNLGGGPQLKPRGLSFAEDEPTTGDSGDAAAGGGDSTSPITERRWWEVLKDIVVAVFLAVYDKTPSPVSELAPLASEEGQKAAQGELNSLQAHDATYNSGSGDEAGNEEYYRRRGQSTAGFWKSKMGDGKEEEEEKKEEGNERPTDDAPVTGPVADRLNSVPVPGPKFRAPAGGPDPVGPEGGDNVGGPDPFGLGNIVVAKPGFIDPSDDPSTGGGGLVEGSGIVVDSSRGPDFVNPRWVDATEPGEMQTELGTHNPGAGTSLVESSGGQPTSPPPAAPAKGGLRAARVVAAAVLAIGLIIGVNAIVSRDVGGREDVPTDVSEIGQQEGTFESDSFPGEGGSTGVSGRDARDAGQAGPASDSLSEGTGGVDDRNAGGSTSRGTSTSDGKAQTQPDPNNGEPFENDGPTTPDEGPGGQPDPNQGQVFDNNGPTTPDGGNADPIPELN